jgi:hypothetical protein
MALHNQSYFARSEPFWPWQVFTGSESSMYSMLLNVFAIAVGMTCGNNGVAGHERK